MNPKTELAEQIRERASSRNLFQGRIKITSLYQKPSFSGVNRKLNNISVTYNPDYPIQSNFPERDFTQALDSVVEHEILHKEDGTGRGCPKTEELGLDQVLIPIAKKLKSLEIPNVPYGTQGHTVYTFFANLLEDLVVNTIGAENRGSEGFFKLYEDMMEHNGCSELFEAFLKVQARIFPDRTGVSRLIHHFPQSPKANQVYKTYLERTGLMKIDKSHRANYLSNPDNWKTLSEIFAEEFSKLLDLNNLSQSYFVLLGGNDFASLDDEEVQMQAAVKAYRASSGQFEPPAFMEDNLALLSLYRHWARKMEIKTETSSLETKRPVAYVARRQFNFEKDSIDRLSYELDSRGKMQAQTGKFPVQVTSRYQISAGHFPEIRVGLIDCSDSARRSINGMEGIVLNPWAQKKLQWTDTSIYHRELQNYFGLCELFRRKGALKSSNVKLGLFSDTTRIAKNMEESERLALQPTFGGTTLDENYLNEFFAGRDSLLYTISDGEVNNWNSIKDKFIERAKKHHYFHLQIGSESQMYRDLKEAGLKAVLDDGSSEQILVDLTLKEIYGGKL